VGRRGGSCVGNADAARAPPNSSPLARGVAPNGAGVSQKFPSVGGTWQSGIFFHNINKVYYFSRYFIFKKIVMATIVILNLFQDAKTYSIFKKIVIPDTGPRKMRKHFLGGFGPEQGL